MIAFVLKFGTKTLHRGSNKKYHSKKEKKGILGSTLYDKGGQNVWVDLCIYVCFCNCICYVTVFLKLKPACKCVSSWQSGSRPMIDRLCLSLTASLLISQSEMVSFLFQSHLHPFLFSIHIDFNLIQIPLPQLVKF